MKIYLQQAARWVALALLLLLGWANAHAAPPTPPGRPAAAAATTTAAPARTSLTAAGPVALRVAGVSARRLLGGDITRVEYFVDTDPGFGNGTAVPVTAGANLSGLSFSVNLSGLSAGFHRLSTRTRDADGKWSLTTTRSFYIETPAVAPPALVNITKAEYFIDNEPGFGNGVDIPVAAPATTVSGLAFTVDLSALSKGFHRLSTRTRDAGGKWSLTTTRSFYIETLPVAPPALANITRIEHFFDTDPGFGSATSVPIATPAPDLAGVQLLADASVLPDGPHRLFVRSRDANGKWSLVLNRAFVKNGCASSVNLAAGRPAASYVASGSGLVASVAQGIFNGTVTNAFFQNDTYIQVDLGASPRTVSDVQLKLFHNSSGAVSYTLRTEVSTDLNTWTTADTYEATLPGRQSAPMAVARTLSPVPANVRGLRLRLLLPPSVSVVLSEAAVYFFNCGGPTITSFTPAGGPAGTVVDVVGTNLIGATGVTFNGVAAGAISNNTNTGLRVAAPAGGTTGQICVTTPAGVACSAQSYTYPLAIATGSVPQGAVCAGQNITVPFSANMASFGAGNTFNFQLSNASGVFAADAPLLGSLSSSTATGGSLNGLIPVGTPGGTGYRVRVVASNPAVVGTDNGANLTINASPVSQATGPASVANGATINLSVTPTIAGATYAWSGPGGFTSTQQSPTTSTTTAGTARYSVTVTLGACSFSSFVDVSVQPAVAPILTLIAFTQRFCLGGGRGLSFTVSGNPFPEGNTVTAQLSDAAGSFAAPLSLGSVAFSGQGNGSLVARIPATATPGSGYRIRLVGSSPAGIVSNDNGSDLTLSVPPTITIGSNSPVAEGGTIQLTGGPAATGNTYAWVFTADGGGSVTISDQQNPQLPNAVPSQSGSYQLTITNAAGCTATASVAVVVTPSAPATTITLTAPAGPLCAGSSYSLPYSASGPAFTAGNVISAVLSDASGVFSASSPVVIGSSATTAASGSISATIPANTPAGSGYRLRLVSSAPAAVSSGSPALIISNLTAAAAGSNSPVATGASITLTATGIAGATYAWTGPGGYSASGPNQTINGATAANAGPYSVLISLNGCTTTVSTTVVVSPPTAVASIQTSAITGSFCAGTAVSVPFTALNFGSGNVFTAQLSDAAGSFGLPVTIGTLTGSAGSTGGTIAATIPAATAAGTGYRIRVVGSQPAVAGADNGSNLSVTAAGVLTWLGTVDANWFEPANWSCGQVPAATSTVLIPAGLNRYPALGAGSSPTALHLTVAGGGSLTLTGTLTLLGNLVNNGTLSADAGSLILAGSTAQTLSGTRPLRLANLTVRNAAGASLLAPLEIRRMLTLTTGNLASAGNLTLLSDNTGTAMVVNPAGGGVVTGLATAQRYVDGSRNPGLGYRHFAAPVSSPTTATVADLRGPGLPLPVVNPAYNTAADPFAVRPFPTVFRYNEQRLTATTGPGSTFGFGWESPTLAEPLAAGAGFTVNLAPTTLSLTGTLRTGAQPALTLRRGGTANSGWQLLGNPYPAPLNWDKLARPAGLDDALYVFESSDQYGGAYVAYVDGIGPAGANLVASGQAFFGRVSNGTTSTTLTFTDAARETEYVSPVQRRGPPETRPLLELALRGPAAGTRPDVLYVYQQAGATAGFDRRHDALKVVLNGGQQPTLYQQAGEMQLSIQGLPADNLPQTLPLGVNAPLAGPYVFTTQRLDNFPAAATLVLEDRQTGIRHDLRAGGPYAATLPAGLSTARFVLHLNAQGPLATNPGAASFAELQLYPNPAASDRTPVRVVATGRPAALAGARLSVLNSVGQLVYQAAGPATVPAAGLRLALPTAGLAAGVYTVRLTTTTGVLTRKLLIN